MIYIFFSHFQRIKKKTHTHQKTLLQLLSGINISSPVLETKVETSIEVEAFPPPPLGLSGPEVTLLQVMWGRGAGVVLSSPTHW